MIMIVTREAIRSVADAATSGEERIAGTGGSAPEQSFTPKVGPTAKLLACSCEGRKPFQPPGGSLF